MPETLSQKKCCTCKQFKSRTEFYKCRSTHDGLYPQCRICNLNQVKSFQRTARGRLLSQARCRKYHQTDKGKQNQLKHVNEYYKTHQLERKARAYVANLVKNGTLIRPQTCCKCDKSVPDVCRIEAHHINGYAREHWLDLEWVCSSCHKIIEKTKRNSDGELPDQIS